MAPQPADQTSNFMASKAYYVRDVALHYYLRPADAFVSLVRGHVDSMFAVFKDLPLASPAEKPLASATSSETMLLALPSTKPVLVLDLDDTLVFTKKSAEGMAKFDFVYEGMETVDGEATRVKYWVRVFERPHLATFLARMAGLFDLVVYTAADRRYAQQVLEVIDAGHDYFKLCFSREDCVRVKGKGFTKDLRIVRGWDMREALMVDNSVLSFVNFLNHGIPILPYSKANARDTELLKLADYLTWLHGFRPNLVLKNSEYFKLHVGLRCPDVAKVFADMFRCPGLQMSV